MAHDDDEPRYDHITIKNAVDGTEITGHEAVKEYFEKEAELVRAHGNFVYFQFYRATSGAASLEEFQGERLVELPVDPGHISGDHTVEDVRRMLVELDPTWQTPSGTEAPVFEPDDALMLFFDGYGMRPDRLFFADHYMMLPSWVQVLVHKGTDEEFIEEFMMLARREHDAQKPSLLGRIKKAFGWG